MKIRNSNCIFVPATTSSKVPNQVFYHNNTNDKGAVFPKGNICKGNFTEVVATPPPYFFDMLQSQNNKKNEKNSNVPITSNSRHELHADLQANFTYTVPAAIPAAKQTTNAATDAIKAFFEMQSALSTGDDLMELFQSFMNSNEFNDADRNHRSDLLFTVTQVTNLLIKLENTIL